MKYYIYTLITILLSSCYKTSETLSPLTISNPKEIINNTSNWTVSRYTQDGKDSTIIFSKYWVSFNEDNTCAERIKFIHPLSEIWGIWDVIQYADGTAMIFWIPPATQLNVIEGEWYFNELTNNKIHLYRKNKSGAEQQIIINKK